MPLGPSWPVRSLRQPILHLDGVPISLVRETELADGLLILHLESVIIRRLDTHRILRAFINC